MSSNFANFWQLHTSGNFKQKHVHSTPHFILYVRTVPCKNNKYICIMQYKYPHKMPIAPSGNCQLTFMVTHNKTVHYYQSKCSKCCPLVLNFSHRHAASMPLMTILEQKDWNNEVRLRRRVDQKYHGVKSKKIVVSYYKVQYKHVKCDVVGGVHVFVSKSVGVSSCQELAKLDDI